MLSFYWSIQRNNSQILLFLWVTAKEKLFIKHGSWRGTLWLGDTRSQREYSLHRKGKKKITGDGFFFHAQIQRAQSVREREWQSLNFSLLYLSSFSSSTSPLLLTHSMVHPHLWSSSIPLTSSPRWIKF